MIPGQMTAIVVANEGQPPQITQAPVPQPGPGEVLVKMAAASINPSDLSFNKYGAKKPLPFIPGIEGSGTVVEAGQGLLPRTLLGRRVICSQSSGGGTWAEYMVTRAASCIPLRSGLSFEQGAAMLVNPLTALAIVDMARREGRRAIANNAAASALGRMFLRLGQKYGLPVINVVRKDEQERVLREEGARFILRSDSPDFRDEYRRLTDKLQATMILDAVGGELGAMMLESAPAGSHLLAYGIRSGEPLRVDPMAILLDRKIISGFYLRNWISENGLPGLIKNAIRAQIMAPRELRTHIQGRFPLHEMRRALETYQANPTAGKALFTMTGGEG